MENENYTRTGSGSTANPVMSNERKATTTRTIVMVVAGVLLAVIVWALVSPDIGERTAGDRHVRGGMEQSSTAR